LYLFTILLLYIWFEHPGHTYRGFSFVFSEPGCDNIQAAIAPNTHGLKFFVFDFIWVEIKAISKNPLKSCGYAPYIMHMIEQVTARIFHCEKEHHPLRTKNDLRAPMEDRREVVG
jgi:hypothetical protein